MARLDYRPIAAPDFSTALQGLNLSNQMLTSGLSGLGKAFQTFDNTSTTGANQEVLMRAMGYTDRDALQQAITDRTLFAGYSPSNITADTLSSIGSRQAALLSRASGEESLNQTKYDNRRKQAGNAAMDAVAPQMADIYASAAGMSPLGNLVRNLSPEQSKAFFSNIQGLQGTDTANKSSLFNLGKTVRDDTEGRQADALANQALLGANDPTGYGDILRGSGANPSVMRRATSQLGNVDLSGIGGGGVSTQPPSPSLFGSLLQTESGGQQFNADGSVKTSSKGAIGIAQVMPSTGPEAAKLAGVPWDENKFKSDPAYNASLGEAYFNKQRADFGSDEKALAAYNAGPGAVRSALSKATAAGKPDDWLTFLPKETQDYVPKTMTRLGQQSGTNLQQLAAQNAQAQRLGAAAGVENAMAQGSVQVGSLADRINKAIPVNMNKDEAIQDAKKRGIPVSGVQADRALEYARANNVPYSVALELMAEASVPTRWGSFVDGFVPFATSDSRKIDFDKYETAVAQYGAKGSTGFQAQADTAGQLRVAQSNVVQQQQVLDQATQRLTALQQAKQVNPAISDMAIARAQVQVDSSLAQLNRAAQQTEQIQKHLVGSTPVAQTTGQPVSGELVRRGTVQTFGKQESPSGWRDPYNRPAEKTRAFTPIFSDSPLRKQN